MVPTSRCGFAQRRVLGFPLRTPHAPPRPQRPARLPSCLPATANNNYKPGLHAEMSAGIQGCHLNGLAEDHNPTHSTSGTTFRFGIGSTCITTIAKGTHAAPLTTPPRTGRLRAPPRWRRWVKSVACPRTGQQPTNLHTAATRNLLRLATSPLCRATTTMGGKWYQKSVRGGLSRPHNASTCHTTNDLGLQPSTTRPPVSRCEFAHLSPQTTPRDRAGGPLLLSNSFTGNPVRCSAWLG